MFKQRETPVENIAYIAIMSAINIVFVLISWFFPILLVGLVILLTLTSTIICVFCKNRYFPIYFIVVIAICSMISWTDTIFFILPSLLVGFIFGLTYKIKISSTLAIVLSTVLLFGLTYLSIPIIKGITGRDFLNDIMTILYLQSSSFLTYARVIFVTLISFIQVFISYLFLHFNPISKVFLKENDKFYVIIDDIFELLLITLSVLFITLNNEFFILFLFLSYVIALNKTYKVLSLNRKALIICLGLFIIASIVIFASLYSLVPIVISLALLELYPLLTCLLDISVILRDK